MSSWLASNLNMWLVDAVDVAVKHGCAELFDGHVARIGSDEIRRLVTWLWEQQQIATRRQWYITIIWAMTHAIGVAWVGMMFGSVWFVCLFISSITQKRMIPKCSKLVRELMTMGYTTSDMVLGWTVKIRIRVQHGFELYEWLLVHSVVQVADDDN